MKKFHLALTLTGLLALFSGCESVQKRIDHAEVEHGPRFDEDGKFTDEPEVSVPLWNSKGIKPKPRDVTPPRD